MRPVFKVVLAIIMLFECILTGTLGYFLYQRTVNERKVLGVATVVPLKKEDFIVSSSENLQYFYEPKPNTHETEHPDWLPNEAVHTINSDSLNDRNDYFTEKLPFVFRIIILGDSFTFGEYVNTADIWPEQLEEMLNSGHCGINKTYEVINLGVGGYDVQYIAHRYALRGIKYNPDLIIWLESNSGFDRMVELMHSYIEKYNNVLTQQERDNFKSQNDGLNDVSWKYALKEIHNIYGEKYIFDQIGEWWKNFFKMRGTTPVLITTFDFISPLNRMKLKYWTNGQPNVTVTASISNIYDKDGGLPDGHPNVWGHQLIAVDTYHYLLEHSSLIGCK
jgi:hypothetical protein